MSDPAPVVADDALDEHVERVLVITAHPDDVDFGAAGTVARWTDAGIEVAYCIVTDGDAGGFDPDVPRTEIPGMRRAEQRAAAKAVGVHDVTFLGHADGALAPTFELRRDLTRAIRRVRPQRVVTQSPERDFRRIFASHPDHLAAGEAALCAVYPDARNPFAHQVLREEGYEAWVVSEVWLMAAPAPNRFVDVTDTLARKLDALRCHESQIRDEQGLEDRIRGWGEAVAREAGLAPGRLAEGFLMVDTAE